MKNNLVWAIAIHVLLLLTACGGGGGDAPPPANGGGNPPVTGNLVNGMTVTGTDGVAIHALNSSLSAPIDVFISSAAPPVEPMWSNAQVVGNYYQLRANQDTWVSAGSPFVLSFPVPSGADTAHLALAARIDSGGIQDGGRTGWEWVLLEGFYNETDNTFVTTLPFLAGDDRTFVLVTHPNFESPSPGTAPLVTTSRHGPLASASVAAKGVSMVGYDFIVNCKLMSAGDCSDAFKQGVANAFADARSQITSMGFSEPALEVKAMDIGLSSGDLVGLGYKVRIVPSDYAMCYDDGGKSLAGVYYSGIDQIYICVPDPTTILTADMADTIVHEYFHATQFSYPLVFDFEPWLTEGTATAAEKSFHVETGTQNKMYRTYTRIPRTVDIELRSVKDLHEYEVQDFWVYAGRKVDRDLDALIPILDQGGSLDAINTSLYGENLKEMYWHWVKNDVFEKTINTRDETNPFPCSIDFITAGTIWSAEAYRVYSVDGYTGLLPPLTSMVIKLIGGDGPIHLFTPMLYNTDAEVMFKVYIDEEPGCEQIPDGERVLIDFDPYGYYGTPKDYYVVISNTDLTQDKFFTLRAKEVSVPQ